MTRPCIVCDDPLDAPTATETASYATPKGWHDKCDRAKRALCNAVVIVQFAAYQARQKS